MSSQINPKLLLHRTESGTKRLREKEEHGSSSQEAFFKKMSLDSTLPTIQKLRLEAIFHPKFENEKSDQILRSQMLQNVASNLGYLEVTLKHSGSLVLWSGGRRFYSKNSTSNLFTYTAEILLKQHFERAWRTEENGLIEYENCSQYLLENRLTLSFEVVAHVLGDHGELPRRDFCMLTAIADRSKERFYSTPQILKFSQQFRLPHNDSWVFWSPTAAQALFYLYDSSRETGLAEDTVAALDAASESKVASMYPHVDFQGNILEGFIVRYIPLDRKSLEDVQILTEGLSQTAQDILRQVPPDFPPSFELYQHGAFPSPSVLSVNIRDIFQETGGVEAVKDAFTRALRNILKERTGNDAGDNNDASLHHWQRQTMNKIKDLPDRVHYLIKSNDTETRRIAQLLQVLHSLKKAVTYKLVQDGARHICIIHVLHDETFPLYHKRMAPDGMRLFRGFSIELVADGKEEPSGMQVEDGIDSIDTTGAETLMLKMKMLPYMIRTFICRNLLTSIQQQGSALFQQQYMKLFKKWNISQTSKERWIPFLEAWAVYVGNPKEDLPPLTEFHYLAHLEHLSKLYESGATAVGKQISNAVPSFRGLVCVVSRTKVHAKHAATLLAKSLNGRVEDIEQVATGGVDGVYYGSLGDGSRSVRKALKEAYESNILVMVLFGLCQEDIENEIRCEDLLSCTSPNNEQKKCVGMTKSWRKFACTLSLDLAKNDLPKGGEGEPQLSEAFRDAVKTIQQVAPSSEQQSKQPGLFVFFPGIPGCGKSTLLLGMEDDLQQRLNAEKKGREGPSSPLTRKVFVRMGDEVGKTFWQVAKNIRRKDSSCILIADKNTPPASWSNVGNTCSETSGVPLPVLPDESIMQTTSVKGARKPDGCFSEDCTHFYPFSLAFLAVCMARVLDREPSSHAGKLDSGTPIACMIVVFFYSFYRYMSAEELQDTIESKLSNAGTLNSMRPLRIPFLNKDPILPEDLKEILVEALHLQLGYDASKKRVEATDPQVLEIESRLRNSILSHRKILLSISVDVNESRQLFMEQMVDRVNALNKGLEEASSENKEEKEKKMKNTIKLVSLDVDRIRIHGILKEQVNGGDIEFLNNADVRDDGCYAGEDFISSTHVTMALGQRSTQPAMRDSFGALLGSNVEIVAKGFFWDDRVAALAVDIAETSLDGKRIPTSDNEFPHVTVWINVSAGARAHMANELPSLVEAGNAKHVDFSAPVALYGTISFWDPENKVIPTE